MLTKNSRYILMFFLLLIIIFSFSTVHAGELEEEKIINMPVYNLTSMNKYLQGLPEPEQKIKIAVYQLNDRTGQYLHNGNGASNSTAISQGATSMLINSLIKSRQFIVADRSILNPFMTEQDLKNKKNNGFNVNNSFNVNGIIESEYIITGSISEYGIIDSSGTKIKINGKGLSNEGVIAYAALDLRVVNSNTNEVEYTVSMKDGIRGKKAGIDVLSFLGSDYVLDLETGKGFQEPINLVVRRLIDAAVYELSINYFAEKTGINGLLDDEEISRINKTFLEDDISYNEKKSSNGGLILILLGAVLGYTF